MALKRAVEGRSKKYDDLLLDYKRATIPGFIEPVKRETKAEKKEKKDREREEKKKKAQEAAAAAGGVPKKKAGGNKKAAKDKEKQEAAAAQAAQDEEDEADMDSDVEYENLMTAVRANMKATARPLAKPVNVSSLYVSRNERLRCCADIVFNALKRPAMSGFGAPGGTGVGIGMGLSSEDMLMR